MQRVIAALAQGRMTRREVVKLLMASGAAATLLPGLGRAEDATVGGIPLARPDQPVTLPTFQKPIESGLKPESGGDFFIFNYDEYVDPKLMTDFGKKYGVNVVLNIFADIDEAISKLANGTVEADVTELTNNRIAQAVAGKLLQPINHDYIPNLKANVWPSLHSPYYDQGSQYTVPYTVYSTGLGWRADLVAEDIAAMDNPWSILWQAEKYKGHVGILSDSREAMVLPMLYRGKLDVNTEDPAAYAAALEDLMALIPICNPKIVSTGYQTLPDGNTSLHHIWSGQMLAAAMYNAPDGFDTHKLKYWAAPKGKVPVQNDVWAVTARSKKPVLAHLWLDFLLDNDNAYQNFVDYNGYQPPITSITAERLIAANLIPDTLHSALLSADDFGPGTLQEGQLTPTGQKLVQEAYAKFSSGA
ncbi:spermidine/putrescine ABC transporter substrate-binding protein [Dongia sp. agr-C8]